MTEDYKRLTEQVRDLDPKAAEYMETEAPKSSKFTPAGELQGCFIWYSTPQGHDYWERLAMRLEEDLYAEGEEE